MGLILMINAALTETSFAVTLNRSCVGIQHSLLETSVSNATFCHTPGQICKLLTKLPGLQIQSMVWKFNLKHES